MVRARKSHRSCRKSLIQQNSTLGPSTLTSIVTYQLWFDGEFALGERGSSLKQLMTWFAGGLGEIPTPKTRHQVHQPPPPPPPKEEDGEQNRLFWLPDGPSIMEVLPTPLPPLKTQAPAKKLS